MIEFLRFLRDGFLSQALERWRLSERASDPSVELFDWSAWPRVVGFAEVKRGVQDLASILVCGKFQTVIPRNGADPWSHRQEQFQARERDELRFSVG